MNRQEAATIIKAIGKHAIDTHLTDPGDIVDATVMAVEALVPKPDEATGLVPCGCGSNRICVAEEKNPIGEGRGWVAYCENCFVGTFPSAKRNEAIEVWNRAMGYQEARHDH